jgi:hypothetical protein
MNRGEDDQETVRWALTASLQLSICQGSCLNDSTFDHLSTAFTLSWFLKAQERHAFCIPSIMGRRG